MHVMIEYVTRVAVVVRFLIFSCLLLLLFYRVSTAFLCVLFVLGTNILRTLI